MPLTDTGEREAFRTRDGRVLRVAADDRRYTTAGLLAVEQRLVAGVEEGRGTGRAVVPERVVGALMPKGLSEEQRAMVLALTTRGDAIDVVAGRAGTGKTFALATAHAAWREAGTRVLGVAVARRAARELEQGPGWRAPASPPCWATWIAGERCRSAVS